MKASTVLRMLCHAIFLIYSPTMSAYLKGNQHESQLESFSSTSKELLLDDTQDIKVTFPGSWDYTGQYEVAGISACPDIWGGDAATVGFNGYVGSVFTYQIVNYIPAPGEFLLTTHDSINYLSKLYGHDVTVLHIGDSVSNILRFAAMCSASADHLPLTLAYHYSRWMVENPCGCDNPEIIAHFELEYGGGKTCTLQEPISYWKKDPYFESADIIVIQMGSWWDPSYPCMHNDEEYVEEQFLNTIAHHLREIKTYIARGKLVFWVGLMPSPTPYSHFNFFARNFGRRNLRIGKVLAGSGIIFINPFDILMERWQVDPSFKHDDLHIYGYGPNSPAALVNQFLFNAAAKIKGATEKDKTV